MDSSTVRPSSTDRILSALAHIAILVTGAGGLMIPMLIWSVRAKKSNYTAFQSQQALGYQVIQAIYSTLLLLIFANLYLIILLRTLPGNSPQSLAQIPFQPFILPTVILSGLLGLYLLPAVVGTLACLLGYPFYYPLFGKQLEAYLTDPAQKAIQSDSQERWLAANCHLCLMIPILGMLVPLLAWMLEKDSRLLRFHALQALLYQAFGMVVSLIAGTALLVTGLLPVAIINCVAASSLSLYGLLIPFYCTAGVIVILILLLPVYSTLPFVAAYRLLKGREYRYPILGKWLQKRLCPAVRS